MKAKGFKIPEHYFEDTKLKLEQISEKPGKPKLRWLYLSIVSAAAILVLALYFWNPAKTRTYNLENLPSESLSAYLIGQEELFLLDPGHRSELYSLGDSLNLNTLDSNLILDYLDESPYFDSYENYTL